MTLPTQPVPIPTISSSAPSHISNLGDRLWPAFLSKQHESSRSKHATSPLWCFLVESSEPPRVRVVEVELDGIFCKRKRAEFIGSQQIGKNVDSKIEAARFPISRGPSDLSARRTHSRPLTSLVLERLRNLTQRTSLDFGCKPASHFQLLTFMDASAHGIPADPENTPPVQCASVLSAKVCQTVNHPARCDELPVIGGVITSKCT